MYIIGVTNSPFIMKFFGTYQTEDELIIVSEMLTGGELWSVIYETEQYSGNSKGGSNGSGSNGNKRGLTITLAMFYTASIVSALAHLHDRGIVYRDLKVCIVCIYVLRCMYGVCIYMCVYM